MRFTYRLGPVALLLLAPVILAWYAIVACVVAVSFLVQLIVFIFRVVFVPASPRRKRGKR